MIKLIKKGNTKIAKTCGIFNLPVSSCAHQCPGCYAAKPEKRFPAVKVSRDRNYQASLSPFFAQDIIEEIKKSKVIDFRIHESGDFYSQEYIDTWKTVALLSPQVKFYFYTKNAARYDFKSFISLPNVNMVDSITPLGLNYGNQDYCDVLVKDHGFTLCPCHTKPYKTKEKQCMLDCKVCGTTSKVCFIQH
jgi:hypothetical protein